MEMELAEEKVDLYSWLMDKVNLLLAGLYELDDKEDVESRYYQQINVDSFQSMSLRIVEREIIYSPRRLLEAMVGMVAEFAMLELDKKTKTRLLKNTTWPKVYALDFLRSQLVQYVGIKCLTISNKKLTASFKSPLEIKKIQDVFQTPYLAIGKLSVEKREEKQIINYYFKINDRDVFVASNYSFSFLYQIESDLWTEYLQMFAELIVRIHQNLIYKEGIRSVFMSNYNPFYRLMNSGMFDNQLSLLFESIEQLASTGRIPTSEFFSETRKSALYLKSNKLYKFKDEIAHLHYVVVCPDKEEIYINFKPFLNFKEINDYLKTINLSLNQRKEKLTFKKVFKKGGGQRKIERVRRLTSDDVIDQAGRRIASFSGKSTVVLYLKDKNNFKDGLELLTHIYYYWLYYTSWMPTADIPHSDLTSIDRTVITNLDILFNLYSTFLAPVFGREFFSSDDETIYLSEKEWLINFLKKDPASRYEEKMLHLLEYIKEKIDLPEFLSHVTGNSRVDIEARKRLVDLYDKLIRQLSLTQGFINSPNNFN
ncbi:MAG: hypothetical protein WC249_01090 [Patescibacteria group bacterium]|jgi:hypothetical protein